MKDKIGLIIAFIIEASLLTVVVIFLLLGLAGIILPIVPGLVLIGCAAAIYTFLLRSEKNKMSHFSFKHLKKFEIYLNRLKNNPIYMGLVKAIKKRKEQKLQIKIIQYGFILLGFNLALMVFMFFVLMFLGIMSSLAGLQGLALALSPLLSLFLFAAICTLVWYRFGQILATVFKKNKVINSSIVVLISVIPLLLFLFFISLIISIFELSFFVVIFMVAFLTTVMASVFEVFIVNLGVITK